MNFSINTLIQHAKISFENAEKSQSKLTNEILNLSGMSGKKTRHLYNNIGNLPGATYFEIGTYTGSTLISALYENDIHAFGMDNFSEFGGPKEKCLFNLNTYVPNQSWTLIEKNFYKWTEQYRLEYNVPPIDIFMYDGMHTKECQYDGIVNMFPYFSDNFILIVDDWLYEDTVVKPTYKALKKIGVKIHYEKTLVTNENEGDGKETYWNGFGLFVCSKV